MAYSYFEHIPDPAHRPQLLQALGARGVGVRPAGADPRACRRSATDPQGARGADRRSRSRAWTSSAAPSSKRSATTAPPTPSTRSRGRKARRPAPGRCGAGAREDRRQAGARDAGGAAAHRATQIAADDRGGDLPARRQLRVAPAAISTRRCGSPSTTPGSRSCCAARPPALAALAASGNRRRCDMLLDVGHSVDATRRARRSRWRWAPSRCGTRRSCCSVLEKRPDRDAAIALLRRGLRHARGGFRRGAVLRRGATGLLAGTGRLARRARSSQTLDPEAGILNRSIGIQRIADGLQAVRRRHRRRQRDRPPHQRARAGDVHARRAVRHRIVRRACSASTPSAIGEPVLVSSADGVGTKLKVAFMTGRHDTIGVDLVNHCVNDILVQGAEPLFFLDYLATGRLVPDVASRSSTGIARRAARTAARCSAARRPRCRASTPTASTTSPASSSASSNGERLIDGSAIAPGDVLIGLPSSGLHTNGYSLARRIVFERLRSRRRHSVPELGVDASANALLAAAPLVPAAAAAAARRRGVIKGMAHITGGGITENLPRILPAGTAAAIDRAPGTCRRCFAFLQRAGDVPGRRDVPRVQHGHRPGRRLLAHAETAALLDHLSAERTRRPRDR